MIPSYLEILDVVLSRLSDPEPPSVVAALKVLPSSLSLSLPSSFFPHSTHTPFSFPDVRELLQIHRHGPRM